MEETWSTCTHTSLQSLSSGWWAASPSTWHLQSFSFSSKGPGTSNISFHSPKLNLLGRDAIVKLGANVSALLGVSLTPGKGTIQNLQSITDTKEPKPDEELQQACRKLCGEFTELFKPELGCLKDFQLEIKFKAESKPTFCKPRPVPFAILDDLNQAYDAGIAKGVWKPTQFNAYGTPVVPIRKKVLPGQPMAR